MTFVLKQIFWNTAGYRHPSGFRAHGGYPKTHGFGHEEWNNSDILRFERGGQAFRAFHTEGLGEALNAEAGVTIFMYASHDSQQDLVGIAHNVTSLRTAGVTAERAALAKELQTDHFPDEAWAVASVRKCFGQDKAAFLKDWNAEGGPNWIPYWYTAEDQFVWFDPPVRISSVEITGKTKFQTRFTGQTRLSDVQAATIMEQIPLERRNATWQRIYSAIQGLEEEELDVDLADILARKDLKPTEREALAKARVGQGQFRRDLETRWDKACAVTGCSTRAVLRASHTKRWADSIDAERLDPANGLLLIANLDGLFDRGFISFSDQGKILIKKDLSDDLSQDELSLLHLPGKLRLPLNAQEMRYMAEHRARYDFPDQA